MTNANTTIQTIQTYRVRLALGIVADSLRAKPIVKWGTDEKTQAMKFAISTK